jgi:hypothetical protein
MSLSSWFRVAGVNRTNEEILFRPYGSGHLSIWSCSHPPITLQPFPGSHKVSVSVL